MTFKEYNQEQKTTFLMDETLEPVPKGNEITKLDILKSHNPGDLIELRDDVIMASAVGDDEIVVLEALAIDLQDLQSKILKQGMSQSVANEMLRYVPNFLDDGKPINAYTKIPTKTGMREALEAIEEENKSLAQKFKDLVNKAVENVKTKFKWIKEKLFPTKQSCEEHVERIKKSCKTTIEQSVEEIKILAINLAKSDEVKDNLKHFEERDYLKDIVSKFVSPKDKNQDDDVLFIYNLDEVSNSIIEYHKKIVDCVTVLNSSQTLSQEDLGDLNEGYAFIRNNSIREGESEISIASKAYKNLFQSQHVDKLKVIDEKSKSFDLLDKKPKDTDALRVTNEVSKHIGNFYSLIKNYTVGMNKFINFYDKYLDHTNEKGAKSFMAAAKKK